jgi:hypothetical protein
VVRPVVALRGLEYTLDIMSDEALRILRSMTPAQKLKAAELLYDSARRLKAAAVRARHPEWTEDDVKRAVREAFLYGRT